jgi:hypothetical protein
MAIKRPRPMGICLMCKDKGGGGGKPCPACFR